MELLSSFKNRTQMKRFLLCLFTLCLTITHASATSVISPALEESNAPCEEEYFCPIDFTPCQIYYFCNTDTDPCIFVTFDWTASSCAYQTMTFTTSSATCNKPNPTPSDAPVLPTRSSCGYLYSWTNSGMWFDSTGFQDKFEVTVTMRVVYICGPGFGDLCEETVTKTFEIIIC